MNYQVHNGGRTHGASKRMDTHKGGDTTTVSPNGQTHGGHTHNVAQ